MSPNVNESGGLISRPLSSRVLSNKKKNGKNEHPCAAGALFALQWSPFRPLVAAAGTADGMVVLYDLLEGGGEATQPSHAFRACDRNTAVQALAFNPVLKEYLASADGMAVRVWELGAKLSTRRAAEKKVLDRLAEAEGSADVSAILAAAARDAASSQ